MFKVNNKDETKTKILAKKTVWIMTNSIFLRKINAKTKKYALDAKYNKRIEIFIVDKLGGNKIIQIIKEMPEKHS